MPTLAKPPEVRIRPDKVHTAIGSAADIVTARQRGRASAAALGFSGDDVTLVAAVIAEVSRNILDYALRGEVTMQTVSKSGRCGLKIIACDQGPGIPDVAEAMRYGYATRRGIGMGLPGAKWLMDEFDIVSVVGRGTTVTMTKWLPHVADRSRAA